MAIPLPPTNVTRAIAVAVGVAATPSVVSLARAVSQGKKLSIGMGEKEVIYNTVASVAVLSVGAVAVAVSGRARWMIPSLIASSGVNLVTYLYLSG